MTPELRNADAPPRRQAFAHAATVRTPKISSLYTSKLTTTAENEAEFSKREVQRSMEARRFQASLGFPPDAKLISALNAGAFLNCDILPEDIKRATTIWGPNVAALKERTTKSKPMPAIQQSVTRLSFADQHMHCDIMFINKQAYLVSVTHPISIVLVACIDDVTTPALRASIRKMFGTIGSRRISIVRFTSDNEKGIGSHHW